MSGRVLGGVVGGTGPLATAYFLDRVVRLTRASVDQDHVDLVIMQTSTTPDRTAFLLGESEADPGPVMAAGARSLAGLGVGFVVLPCNTADAFLPQVRAAAEVPVLGIVHETVAAAGRLVQPLRAMGVLATDGTVAAGTYARELAAVGATEVLPDAADQALVMSVIYDQVKAGRPVDVAGLAAVVGRLVARGAQCVALACTELSVVAAELVAVTPHPVVDSVDSLARATIRRAGGVVVDDAP